MSIVTSVLPWTVTTYLMFGLFFGVTIYEEFEPTGCSILLLDCLESVVDIVVLAFDFASFGAFTGALNVWTTGVLFLVALLPWILYGIGVLRGSGG